MKAIQITYDTVEDYDVEYSFWKRMYVQGTYEEVSEMFRSKFPQYKAFGYDDVVLSVEYVKEPS